MRLITPAPHDGVMLKSGGISRGGVRRGPPSAPSMTARTLPEPGTDSSAPCSPELAAGKLPPPSISHPGAGPAPWGL